MDHLPTQPLSREYSVEIQRNGAKTPRRKANRAEPALGGRRIGLTKRWSARPRAMAPKPFAPSRLCVFALIVFCMATVERACAAVAPARKPKGRGFATASVILGTLGMLAASLAFLLVMAGVSNANDSMRGVNNPLAVSGAAFGIAIGVVAFALPVIAIVFPMNCLGLVLGGVGVCRANGRELGLLGLLLNGVPVLLCCWGLRALVSAL